MDILIKFPSRERPKPFARAFSLWNTGRVRFLVTLDDDDPTLREYQAFLQDFPNVVLDVAQSKTKIEAMNSGVAGQSFDIVALAADDMIPTEPDYDLRIAELFRITAPDLDAVMYCPDGRRKDKLNTNVVMGRKYFERFGYLYHPSYISLFADNELTDVSRSLGKEIIYPGVLLKHEWIDATGKDALHLRNEGFYNQDMATYYTRKVAGFPCEQAASVNC